MLTYGQRVHPVKFGLCTQTQEKLLLKKYIKMRILYHLKFLNRNLMHYRIGEMKGKNRKFIKVVH